MAINPIQNGELGSSVRSKLNQAIQEANKVSGKQDSSALGSAAFQPASAFDAAGSAQEAEDFAVQRENHTGTQGISTVSGLRDELDRRVIYVDTVADLQALDTSGLVEGQRVITSGYNNTDDGGGNDYIIAPQESEEDGGSVIHVGVDHEARGLFSGQSFVTTAQFGGDPSALQNAIDYAKSSGILKCVVTESNDFGGIEVSVPAGITLVCQSADVVLGNVRIVSSGSVGSEINMTAEASPGDRVIYLEDVSSLSSGSIIKLVSAINSNSEDAGGLRLGDRVEDNSHFSEFCFIESVNGSEVTLESPVLWSYPTSGGQDSVLINKSVAIPVYFNENIHIDVNQEWLGSGYPIELTLCKNSTVSGNISSEDQGSVMLRYCYKTRVSGINSWQRTDAPSTLSVILRSCSHCKLSDSIIIGGSHGFDATYQTGDSDLYGGPSIFCECNDSVFHGQNLGAATSHPGCFSTIFQNNTAYRKNGVGFRLRSKGDTAFLNKIFGSSENSVNAFLLSGSIMSGSKIFKNFAYNCEAFATQTSQPIYDGSASLLVEGNESVGCQFGYRTLSMQQSITTLDTLVKNNIWRGEGALLQLDTGVSLDSYTNGVTVEGNVSIGASVSGVRYFSNVSKVRILGNRSYRQGEGAFGVRGRGTAFVIDDLSVYPGGDSDAQLEVRGNTTDGTGSEFAGLVRNFESYKRSTEAGFQSFVFGVSDGQESGLEPGTINIYVDKNSSPKRVIARVNDGEESTSIVLGTYGS